MTNERIETVKASLEDGTIVQIQVAAVGGRQDVAGGRPPSVKDLG